MKKQALVGYHASHEQFAPSALLACARQAQDAGFGFIHSSDHFQPWTERQGQSGFSFAWLGAAMQATHLPFSVIAAAGYRYHPAIVAQAVATLAEMFPGRFSFALGSGEAINEAMTGLPWPEKAARNDLLCECAGIIRALLAGETVRHRGGVTVIDAKIYSRPANPPLMFGAAVSPATAERVAGWADGLLTTAANGDAFRRIADAYRDAGGRGPIHLQLAISWAANEAQALAQTRDQWAGLAAGSAVNGELARPADFAAIADIVSDAALRRAVYLACDAAACAAWCQAFLDAGAEALQIHNVGTDQAAFIAGFGASVLPQLG